MSRAERRRIVADIISRHIISSVAQQVGADVRCWARPDQGELIVEEPETGLKVTHRDIRFCCPEHCWADIEHDAAAQILDQFRYMLIKVIKLTDPPDGPTDTD